MGQAWRLVVLLLALARAHEPAQVEEGLCPDAHPGSNLLQRIVRQEASEGEGKVDVGKGKAEEEGEEEDAEDVEEVDAAVDGSCNSKCEKVLKFMPLDGVSKSLPYYAIPGTPDIQKGSGRAKKALLVFHGVGMNPDGYFCYVYNALKASKAKEKDWYIASVGLFTDAKVKGDSRLREKGAMSWRSSSYWAYGKRGESSLSSFEAVDQMLAHFRNKKQFKRLTEVVVAGHGGGAQFVQRFALMGGSTSGIKKVRYVVANPSTYFYATQQRPVLPKKSSLTCDSFDAKKYTAGSWSFKVPDETKNEWLNGIKEHAKKYRSDYFSRFDNYEYGMTGVPEYFPDESRILRNMKSRRIMIVSAYHDACNHPLQEKMLNLNCGFCCEHPAVDKPANCKYDAHQVKYPPKTTQAAMLQGLTRAQRAWAYMDYVNFLFPKKTKHTFEAVEGKHSSCEIFQSKEGQRILFG